MRGGGADRGLGSGGECGWRQGDEGKLGFRGREGDRWGGEGVGGDEKTGEKKPTKKIRRKWWDENGGTKIKPGTRPTN